MKTPRLLASLLLFALCAVMACTQGVVVSAVALTAGSLVLLNERPAGVPAGALCTVTLTPTILLQRTIRALFVKVPALAFFASEFTTERLKLNQNVVGKIRLRPQTALYDATTGYKNGAQEARDLLIDVPFVMDQHIHCTIKLDHLNAIADDMNKLSEHIEDSASVIGKTVARYLLGKVRSASFSNGSTYTTGNSDKDMLNAVRKSMNARGVPDSRFGIVNSDVAETLLGDARITNRYDNASQTNDGMAHMHLKNIAGFRDLIEDPELDDGTTAAIAITAEADDDLITTASAHGLLVGDRVNFPTLTGGTGLTASSVYYYVQSVPSTTTLKVSATRGGAAVNITADATAGTIIRADNISGFFGTREAIAFKAGLPSDSIDVAAAFGIPVPANSRVVTDPDSGLSMLAYMWFEPNTMDAYVTLTALFGAVAGELADTGRHAMEPSGHILRTA